MILIPMKFFILHNEIKNFKILGENMFCIEEKDGDIFIVSDSRENVLELYKTMFLIKK